MQSMNLLLGINTVLALFALFATVVCILGWVGFRLLKSIARMLMPLVKDEEQPARRPQPRVGGAAQKNCEVAARPLVRPAACRA